MIKKEKIYNELTIIGGGLIGVSLAKIVRKNNLVEKIKLYDRCEDVCCKLSQMSLVDKVYDNILEAVKGSDIVVLAVPVGVMGNIVSKISVELGKGTVLTDTGSTKASVIEDIKPHLPNHVHFIPSHPLAGTEKSGPEAGLSSLFKGKYWVLCPDNKTPNLIIRNFENFLSSCGAITERMTAEYHDKILAITSHLPHLIAYTIVGTAIDLEEQTKHDVVRFSATGFRDFTRIASSDPIMWRDIFLNNKEAVLEMLQRFSEDITYLQRAIRWSEGEKLESLFSRTREIRRSIIKEGQDT